MRQALDMYTVIMDGHQSYLKKKLHAFDKHSGPSELQQKFSENTY